VTTYPVVAVHQGLNSDTFTSQVFQFTELTGNAINVSEIPVTCHKLFVDITGTWVELHLVV
jgi:hypothetical protein